jgi:hypothetical protein
MPAPDTGSPSLLLGLADELLLEILTPLLTSKNAINVYSRASAELCPHVYHVTLRSKPARSIILTSTMILLCRLDSSRGPSRLTVLAAPVFGYTRA